MGEKE
jgi:hypothetical protein